jgi:hypothetical protein
MEFSLVFRGTVFMGRHLNFKNKYYTLILAHKEEFGGLYSHLPSNAVPLALLMVLPRDAFNIDGI